LTTLAGAGEDQAPFTEGLIMKTLTCLAIAAAAAAAIASTAAVKARADAQTDRGKYLVTIAGCNDCHTPGYFFGKPDTSRYLGGSDVGFEIPGLGAFAGRNITPDKDTGIGNWTREQIVTAIQTGKRPDGRQLAPIMPSPAFANLTKDDVEAIAAYLQTLPPVHNAVPGPFGPGQQAAFFLFRILPPGQTVAAAPK
jgi:mono/diheme cytochrome c family protein